MRLLLVVMMLVLAGCSITPTKPQELPKFEPLSASIPASEYHQLPQAEPPVPPKVTLYPSGTQLAQDSACFNEQGFRELYSYRIQADLQSELYKDAVNLYGAEVSVSVDLHKALVQTETYVKLQEDRMEAMDKFYGSETKALKSRMWLERITLGSLLILSVL